MSPADPLSLLLACVISGLVIPVPEDFLLLAAGWTIRDGAAPVPLFLAASAGIGLRDSLAFYAGRLLERNAGRWPRLDRIARHPRLLRARALLDRHGTPAIAAARFAVGMRAPLYFAAGWLGVRARVFALTDLIGLCVSTPLTLYLGWRFGDDAAELLWAGLRHQRLLLMVGALLVGWRLWRGSAAQAPAPPEARQGAQAPALQDRQGEQERQQG